MYWKSTQHTWEYWPQMVKVQKFKEKGKDLLDIQKKKSMVTIKKKIDDQTFWQHCFRKRKWNNIFKILKEEMYKNFISSKTDLSIKGTNCYQHARTQKIY